METTDARELIELLWARIDDMDVDELLHYAEAIASVRDDRTANSYTSNVLAKLKG